MGRPARWFKELFRIKSNPPPPPPPSDDFCRNPYISPAQAAWLTSFYSEPDTEQGMRARALAAATAAAADAAVAAARAAYQAVQATAEKTALGGTRNNWAAAYIQRVFRGFLARKAFRALKGLVKIQALVRGFLVRKRAAAALQSMEALVKAQASVRAKKINILSTDHPKIPPSRKSPAEIEEESPKIVEVDTWCRPKSRSKRMVISKWIAESMCTEDDNDGVKPQMWEECSSKARYGREISSNSWRAQPNYMAKTQSSGAKVRSQSAPKTRVSLREVMVEEMEKGRRRRDFKNAVIGKIGGDIT